MMLACSNTPPCSAFAIRASITSKPQLIIEKRKKKKVENPQLRRIVYRVYRCSTNVVPLQGKPLIALGQACYTNW